MAGDQAPAEIAAPEAVGPATGGVASAGLPIDLSDRDIITSVNIAMSTSDVRQTADDIRRIAAASGGAVFSSDVLIADAEADGSVPGGGQIVIKIAPSDLDQLVQDLDGIGIVTRLSQDSTDVTDQLVDLDIRIRQAEVGIARIETLLDEAVDLDDVFQIESELNDRQVELEQLRASERNTENLVALATLTVQVDYRTPAALDEIIEPDDGISDAFAAGWNAFVGVLFALGFVLAVTAPFLITGLLVLAGAWLLGRRWSRRRTVEREQRRLDADRRGHVPTPPPPVAAQRIVDPAPSGNTLIETDDQN